MNRIRNISKFHIKKLFKSTIKSSLVALLTVSFGLAHAQNFPQIKTFGFDYADLNSLVDQGKWLAARHDWIVGSGPNQITPTLLNAMRSVNPDVKVMKYLAYHSVASDDAAWMENWCQQNGYNPEDLYYHYYVDTDVRLVTGGPRHVPGYGGGTATSLKEARLRVRWNGGAVGIDPSSPTWRAASQALALEMVRVAGTNDQFVDGLFLDSFDGLANDSNWDSHLENTIEFRNFGTKDEVYAQVRADLVDAKMDLENYLKQKTGNPSFVVQVNAADADTIWQWQPGIYMDNRDKTMDVTIEYLMTSAYGQSRIPRLKTVYDELENGRRMFIRSQTNFNSTQRTLSSAFKRYFLVSHYLINHPNAYFFYHEGSANNYGGVPYGNFKETHWNPNLEVNIGVPVVHSGTDYWGASNTDRFFQFAKGSGYTILGREYSNALVLAKFARGGIANVGTNPTTHNLDGTYYPLLPDNTLGTGVTSVTLGESEGAILIKDPSAFGPAKPTNFQASYSINR